jgi:hypothetical protein
VTHVVHKNPSGVEESKGGRGKVEERKKNKKSIRNENGKDSY